MSFEDRLREKLKRAEMQMPIAKVDLQETMVGARRGLMLRYALSTVAIIVAVAGGAFAANDLLGNDVATPLPASSPTPDSAPSPDSATENDAPSGDAVQAVKAWIAALGHGDRKRAWALMTARARASFDSYAAFQSNTDLSEGWAAWAFARDAEYYEHTLVSSEQPTEVVIVTVAGTRQVEGTTERSAGVMVVDVQEDGALVDPLTAAGKTDIDPAGTLEGGGPHEAGKPVSVEAYVPERAREVYFLVSAHPGPVTPAQTEPAGEARVLARSTLAPLPPGNHWVTIATSLVDGSVWTRPVELEVE
jgi:hypothetical protein